MTKVRDSKGSSYKDLVYLGLEPKGPDLAAISILASFKA